MWPGWTSLLKSCFGRSIKFPLTGTGLLAQTLPEFGDSYTSVNGERICVPYDPSTQLMFYRRDLLLRSHLQANVF